MDFGLSSEKWHCFFFLFSVQLSQFRSGFVLVWFVEHVVYGEDLYFLQFDELQIKLDQMNGPVSGGYTCAALWFWVLVDLKSVCTHIHTHPKPSTDV